MGRQIFILGLFAVLCGCEDPAIRNVEEKVRDQLVDPDSARFYNIQQCGSSPLYTGQVNARNPMGGYSGKSSYVFDGSVAILEDDGPAYNVMLEKCNKENE